MNKQLTLYIGKLIAQNVEVATKNYYTSKRKALMHYFAFFNLA